MANEMHATTIFAIRHNGQCAMSGDGQVTLGNAVVMKHRAKKSVNYIRVKFWQDLPDQLPMPLPCLRNLKGNYKPLMAI